MGINPAVFMANYYLFYYEFTFVQQLVDIIEQFTPNCAVGECPYVDTLLDCDDLQDIHDADLTPFQGDAALHLLHCFRHTIRYIDDLTSGPNQWLLALLHRNQTVMGGKIHGIYPTNLALEYTGADPLDRGLFHTLDVSIHTTCHRVVNAARGIDHIAQSVTTLYDKRRQACYAGIPIVQYAHVSSTLSVHCGYNILTGQLHRFAQIIMCRGSFVVEAAKLLRRMNHRGYHLRLLWRKLKYYLRTQPLPYGDATFHTMFTDISACYQHLQNTFGLHNIAAWEAYGTPWTSSSRSWEILGDPLNWDIDSDELMEES